MAIQVLNPYVSSYSGEQIDRAINFVHTQIAEPFNTKITYQLDDFVVYEGLLYQCVNVNGTTVGNFVASD